jgi:transcriptional regulator with XRE-family HTH domain
MFKEELKRLRLSAYFTQAELCTRAEIPLGTYKSWELGLQYPTPRNWKKYIDFMECTNVGIELAKIKKLYTERGGKSAT